MMATNSAGCAITSSPTAALKKWMIGLTGDSSMHACLVNMARTRRGESWLLGADRGRDIPGSNGRKLQNNGMPFQDLKILFIQSDPLLYSLWKISWALTQIFSSSNDNSNMGLYENTLSICVSPQRAYNYIDQLNVPSAFNPWQTSHHSPYGERSFEQDEDHRGCWRYRELCEYARALKNRLGRTDCFWSHCWSTRKEESSETASQFEQVVIIEEGTHIIEITNTRRSDKSKSKHTTRKVIKWIRN